MLTLGMEGAAIVIRIIINILLSILLMAVIMGSCARSLVVSGGSALLNTYSRLSNVCVCVCVCISPTLPHSCVSQNYKYYIKKISCFCVCRIINVLMSLLQTLD